MEKTATDSNIIIWFILTEISATDVCPSRHFKHQRFYEHEELWYVEKSADKLHYSV